MSTVARNVPWKGSSLVHAAVPQAPDPRRCATSRTAPTTPEETEDLQALQNQRCRPAHPTFLPHSQSAYSRHHEVCRFATASGALGKTAGCSRPPFNHGLNRCNVLCSANPCLPKVSEGNIRSECCPPHFPTQLRKRALVSFRLSLSATNEAARRRTGASARSRIMKRSAGTTGHDRACCCGD